MKLSKEQFKLRTHEMAKKSGFDLNEEQLEKLYLYKEMLVEWNEKINLTAILDDEEIISKHIIDSLEIVKYIQNGQKIIDVGTGAGLPGIIIAIYFEGKTDITLLDALNKRIMFLQEVIYRLNLENISLIHGRAEEILKMDSYRETYDIVVCRAVARLNVLMEITVPFIRIGGSCLYMKADKTKIELDESKNAIEKLGIEHFRTNEYTISCTDGCLNHTIIEFKKEIRTKSIYPRAFASIKKSPL